MNLDQEIDDLIRQTYQETKTLLSDKMKLIHELSTQLVQSRDIKGELLEKSIGI
jgi:ATP-dependent Zn protease